MKIPPELVKPVHRLIACWERRELGTLEIVPGPMGEIKIVFRIDTPAKDVTILATNEPGAAESPGD